MTEKTSDQNATKIMYVNHGQPVRTALFAFTAALAGTAVGFVAAIAIAMPVMSRDLASQTKVLDQHLADFVDASGNATACAPTGGAGMGQVLGESVPGQSAQAPSNAEQSQQQSQSQNQSQNQQNNQTNQNNSNQVFVKKLLAGSLVRTAAAISNTGPYSSNEISAQNNVNTNLNTNTNISVKNNTNQWSSSGDASVKDNTYGGAATSGDSTNKSANSLDIQINN